jgi:hypothetical protein
MIRTKLSRHTRALQAKVSLIAFVFAGTILVTPLLSQSPTRISAPASASASGAKAVSTPTRYRPDPFAGRAGQYYRAIWGVDSISVKAAESGELIRFSYRVLDTNKAGPLHDKKVDPFLVFPDAHVKLVIPSLEKVGQLRQTGTLETGRSYWMAFSNPRMTVKRGDHVNVVIGRFHADGLVVE